MCDVYCEMCNVMTVTALSFNAEAFTNNRTSQAVEPEKLTRKFYKNNSCDLLGAGAYI